MVAPLAGYSIRGFIWYQGESNTSAPERYDSLFPSMIQQWRGAWGDQALPFYFVQLANYAPPGGRGQYARLRESQRRALDVPHTGMAVTIDIGQADDIHPRNKQDVGYRLAQWALNRTYGQAVPASGPLFQAMTVKDGVAILRFSYVEGGLVAKGGPLNRFEIAGADSRFLPATAKIVEGTVHVSSDQVPAPVHVRYAWADDPSGCNLYNAAGLPASPFTTEPRKQ
jgi:sialate O-acetylesterase